MKRPILGTNRGTLLNIVAPFAAVIRAATKGRRVARHVFSREHIPEPEETAFNGGHPVLPSEEDGR